MRHACSERMPKDAAVVSGAELAAVAQLATSIMQALAQPQCAALPLGEVIGAAAAAHMATRLSVEPLAQQQIASTAVAALGVPGVQRLQLGGATTTPERAISVVVCFHRSSNWPYWPARFLYTTISWLIPCPTTWVPSIKLI